MRSDELEINSTYAWLGHGAGRPLPAKVLQAPKSGYVKIFVTNPDTGSEERTVPTRELGNLWVEIPDTDRFGWGSGLSNRISDAAENGVELTWERIHDDRIAHIGRQRVLADRLARFGIVRAHAAYIGNNTSPQVQLTPNYAELERLLAYAEAATGPVVDPTATLASEEDPWTVDNGEETGS